ncbi:hypothetical protein BGX24_000433 [Mortierella sp. AD032]|nr:hypothetical protein BGX24_000433 [Mortierella sp. AD032]
MGLYGDLSSMPGNTSVIYLTTPSDPNTLAVHSSNYNNYNSNNHNYYSSSGSGSGSGSGDRTFHDHYQNYQHHHYQHYQQHQQPYSSSSSVGPIYSPSVMTMNQQDEKDVVDPASTQQEGKKKKKKRKKKATSAATLELALTNVEFETTPPPEGLLSVKEQDDDDTMSKEFPDMLKSFAAVQGHAITTKSKGKKPKAKKKAATVAEEGEHQDMAMVAQGQQEPVRVSDNLEYHGTFGDIRHRQVLYSTVASGKDSLDFLNDDFMKTGLSNWADDIDEYEQTHDPPLSISTAFSTSTATTTVTTSPQQTARGDAVPKTLVYKGPIVTQVASFQSQDTRGSSDSDSKKSHRHWSPAPRPFKTRSGKPFHEQPDRSFEYQQPRPPREYYERRPEYHCTPFGEYPGRSADDHHRPPTGYRPAYSHRPPVHEPPTYSHQRSMPGGCSPYQHQALYPSQCQVQQQHFERVMRPTHPRPASQLQQQQRIQQLTKQSSQQQTQPATKNPLRQLPKKPTQEYNHRQPTAITSSPTLDPTPAQAFSKQLKPDSTSQSSTKLDADNPWISHTKPAWVARQGSREGQRLAELQLKSEAEKKGKSTYAAVASTTTDCKDANAIASLQISGIPKDKHTASKPGLDKTLSQSQKKGYLKQEQHLLSHPDQIQTQSQSQDQPQSRDQLKAKSHFRSHQEEQEEIKAVELLWKVNGRSCKSGNGQWGDRNKVIEFFSKRWVEARMSSGGRGPDAAVVYCSSP